MLINCECKSYGCRKTIVLSAVEVARIQTASLILIVEDCPHGPEPSDQLVETREGYQLYREA